MPQLDRIIIFPQIFWLFVCLIFFYVSLVHYFLPKFLVSLKLRKCLLEYNYTTISNLSKNNISIKLEILNNLIHNLTKIKKSIYLNNLNNIFKSSKYVNPINFNKKIISITKNNIIFCNKYLLFLIFFESITLNLK